MDTISYDWTFSFSNIHLDPEVNGLVLGGQKIKPFGLVNVILHTVHREILSYFAQISVWT